MISEVRRAGMTRTVRSSRTGLGPITRELEKSPARVSRLGLASWEIPHRAVGEGGLVGSGVGASPLVPGFARAWPSSIAMLASATRTASGSTS